MKLKVQITKEDIEEAGDQCHNCPVAVAATRALGQAGFDVGDYSPERWSVEWEPYRAFCEPDGLTVWRGDTMVLRVKVGDAPLEAYEFASQFDDWFRYHFRGERPDSMEDDEDDPPPRPYPTEFELELPRLKRPKRKGPTP